ncbi:MAG: hypothetical protein [phage Lak_Megaphage_RVC_AP4_GC26]|nr:MAG: hypothetical protein [phage Lak_Megaphage_RVC_AP4_GC26]
MKLFENIKDWWNSFLDDYHQSSKDKLMQKAFIKVIKEEENDRESFFTANNLRSTDGFTKVVHVIDIPEEYQLKGQPWQIMDKLNEMSYFVSKYLREDLKLGDNVTIPEFYHVEDPSSGKPFSCRYLAIWNYQPVLKSKKKIYIVNSIVTTLVGSGATLLAILLL